MQLHFGHLAQGLGIFVIAQSDFQELVPTRARRSSGMDAAACLIISACSSQVITLKDQESFFLSWVKIVMFCQPSVSI